MRFLAWHLDYFKCRITERGRSSVVEEYDNPETTARDVLLVLASVEKADEARPELVASRAAIEIAEHASSLKVDTVILHPFAHLFGELSRPSAAIKVLRAVEMDLRARGFDVSRTPFGWFNTLDIQAKGHPLSRIARIIPADPEDRD
jgi:threonyl-tRNA synthetase